MTRSAALGGVGDVRGLDVDPQAIDRQVGRRQEALQVTVHVDQGREVPGDDVHVVAVGPVDQLVQPCRLDDVRRRAIVAGLHVHRLHAGVRHRIDVREVDRRRRASELVGPVVHIDPRAEPPMRRHRPAPGRRFGPLVGADDLDRGDDAERDQRHDDERDQALPAAPALAPEPRGRGRLVHGGGGKHGALPTAMRRRERARAADPATPRGPPAQRFLSRERPLAWAEEPRPVNVLRGAGGNRTLVRQAGDARATTIPEPAPLRLAHRRVGGAREVLAARSFPEVSGLSRRQWSLPTVRHCFCCRAAVARPRAPSPVTVCNRSPSRN